LLSCRGSLSLLLACRGSSWLPLAPRCSRWPVVAPRRSCYPVAPRRSCCPAAAPCRSCWPVAAPRCSLLAPAGLSRFLAVSLAARRGSSLHLSRHFVALCGSIGACRFRPSALTPCTRPAGDEAAGSSRAWPSLWRLAAARSPGMVAPRCSMKRGRPVESLPRLVARSVLAPRRPCSTPAPLCEPRPVSPSRASCWPAPPPDRAALRR
jgi:hypothetical protein